MKKKQIVIGGVLAAVVALVLGAAAIAKTGPFSTGAATVLPSATCGLVYYQGSGKPDFIIASDLPLQGAGRIQNLAMQGAQARAMEGI